MKREATKKKARTPREESRGEKRLNFLRKSKWVTELSPESFGEAFLFILLGRNKAHTHTYIYSFMDGEGLKDVGLCLTVRMRKI